MRCPFALPFARPVAWSWPGWSSLAAGLFWPITTGTFIPSPGGSA